MFISWDDAKSFLEEKFYNSYDGTLLTPWKRGTRPRFSYWQENFDADLCAHLYTRNLPRVLAGSPWEYCQIAPFYLSDRTELEVIPFLAAYLRHPFVEYLIKLKLYNLAAHVVYRTVKRWGFDETSQTEEYKAYCHDGEALVRNDTDMERWRIEEHELQVEVAVEVRQGLVQAIYANTDIFPEVFDLDVSDFAEDSEVAEADMKAADLEKLKQQPGWRAVY